jgi:hypothetical protein
MPLRCKHQNLLSDAIDRTALGLAARSIRKVSADLTEDEVAT